jgi:general secretion pathway protein G
MKLHGTLAQHHRRAFTLIELLLVMVILGILAAVVVPKFVGRADQAKKDAARADISHLGTALNTFEVDIGRFPTGDEGLQALIEAPSGIKEGSWHGPYVDNHKVPTDPWGKPYLYACPGQHNTKGFDLSADGHDSDPDNLNNWTQ